MLAACLLVGLFAVLLSSLLLFSPLGRRAPGALPTVGMAVAVAGAAAVGAVALGAVVAYAALGAAVVVAGCLAWTTVTRPWGAAGRVAWGCAVEAGALYLAYMLWWTFRSHLGPAGTIGGLALWSLEAAAYLLGLAYFWEMADVLSTAAWTRRLSDLPTEMWDQSLPFVSLHVPAHNEPPEMVIETLASLLALDYPADRLEIVMIDDNTEDPALWQPVAEFAAQHPDRIRFHHLQDWPGFKSGALNFALTVTDPRAEVIGVVDADYLVDPDYLRRCAPLFRSEPTLGFVQTPQDYRDWSQASYYRRLYYSYSYFFAVSQTSRNERDGAIFGGTMGLIRRSALQQVGGWDEWCITEDAELSLRLLKAGWSGRHIEATFGHGIMPLTFEALKRQRFRWCFGGIQILRMHWRSLMPWNRDEDNKLSPAQRWAYLSGGLQWYGDVLGLAFTAFLLVAIADLALGGGLVFRRLSGFLLAAIPVLVAVNLGRAVAVLRRATGASWRDTLGAFGIWLALGWTVAGASLRGAVAPAGVFLRTPKTRGDASWRDALRANRPEVALATLGLGGMVAAASATAGASRWLLVALLLVPVAGNLAAPLNTVAAVRAELPDELRRRRRTERLRAWTAGPLRPGRVLTGAAAALGVAAALTLVFAPGAPPGPAPSLLHEASGHGPAAVVRSPAGRSGTVARAKVATSAHRSPTSRPAPAGSSAATTSVPHSSGTVAPGAGSSAVTGGSPGAGAGAAPAGGAPATTTTATTTTATTALTTAPTTVPAGSGAPATTAPPLTTTTTRPGPPTSTTRTTPTTRSSGPPTSTPGSPPTSHP